MTGHKERLLKYLQQNGKITTIEAIQKLKNTRLSEYIRQLRADAYVITKSIDSNYGIENFFEII